MRAGAIMTGAAAALALVCAAGEASAQTRSRTPAPTAPAATEAAPSSGARLTPRRGMTLNERGRWGVDFNVSPPVGREAEWGDVEAGAYYRVSPRLQVGASAGLAEPEADPARAPQTDRRAAPRFRLESIFRF